MDKFLECLKSDRVASARQRIEDGQGVTIETLLQDDRSAPSTLGSHVETIAVLSAIVEVVD